MAGQWRGDGSSVLLSAGAALSIAEAAASTRGPLEPAAAPRIGIATMTKQPHRFASWLAYHRERIGVVRFYVRIEGTPGLARWLKQTSPWDTFVTVLSDEVGPSRDYLAQVARQEAHVSAAIGHARADGLTHLLHIDDDELLYCADGVPALYAALAHAPASAVSVHVDNLEALMPRDECDDAFAEVRAFRHATREYGAYSNGKSFGVLRAPRLRLAGAHRFADADDPRAERTHSLPPRTAVVLHYESATLSTWTAKFGELARAHAAAASAPPGAAAQHAGAAAHKPEFDRASLRAAGAVLAAAASADARALGEARDAARELWRAWKREPAGLPAADPSGQPLVLAERGVTLIAPLRAPADVAAVSPGDLGGEISPGDLGGDLARVLERAGLARLGPTLAEEELTIPLLRSMADLPRNLADLGVAHDDALRLARAIAPAPPSDAPRRFESSETFLARARAARRDGATVRVDAVAPAADDGSAEELACVYINLAHRTDRRATIEAALRSAGLGIERFDALRGDGVGDAEVAREYDPSLNARYDAACPRGTLAMSDGERGCAASHVAMWRRCAASGRPLLILEDDARLHADAAPAARVLVRAIERALPPAERGVIFYLGADVPRWLDGGSTLAGARAIWAARAEPGGTRSVRLREAGWAWQTHAYVLWPAGARALLDRLPVDAPVDVFLSTVVHARVLSALVAEPPLALQADPYRGGDVVHSSLADRERLGFTRVGSRASTTRSNPR